MAAGVTAFRLGSSEPESMGPISSLILNRIEQPSQVNRSFSQLLPDPGDLRRNLATGEFYLDSFNAAVSCNRCGIERNAVVGADRGGFRVLDPFHRPKVETVAAGIQSGAINGFL
jgi:hypothetical protein